MADNQAAVAEQQQQTEQEEFLYPIRIEDAGPATKKVTVEIPRQRIEQKLAEQFQELRQQVAIPGFRPGHAPQKLVEKRFSADVREQVCRALISESYQQAVEKNQLQVIGEPEFENPDAIQLPESGDLSYSFQVEVQPQINLPDLSGLKVRKPRIQVTEQNVNQAMQNLREQQGTLVPVEDRGVEPKDYLIADIHLKLDGTELGHQHDAQIVARPGRIAGIDVPDLDRQLAGARSGETRSFEVAVPETHPNEQIRGRKVVFEITIKDIKRLELAEINQEFLEDLGFSSEQELREALREQMVERINLDVRNAMREQVYQYLLDHTSIDLPARLSQRQEQRVIQRRAVDLMLRGVPEDQIVANIERLRSGARDEAIRELKLFFILEKLAADQGTDVSEAELNGAIAMLAAQRGQRPEKLKQQMAKDGTLANMYIQMREHKAVDKLLETAQIEEVELQTSEAEQKE